MPERIPLLDLRDCLYTIQAEDRDQLQKDLDSAGIQTEVHYPLPIHLMPAYADARYVAGEIIRLLSNKNQESSLLRR
jgi:dTDP-4-amino-4,6-dideoxygalactose transaminase